ncbi:hypothetical protein SAMN05444410_10985 [Hydrobacter penzbergensis]|uniref:6-phosphogluconate dehydrogenase n=1 Tax=Hydrobacter penzbergensis TaxID=1235997 RepID=A0A8X8IHZ6_9BACT|nr:hypothetical protein [Hydrobacter penzbergensis]SDX11608.1 hypothetical protein SAMN05444410_10985 [Hydrobacter penzbergensis]
MNKRKILRNFIIILILVLICFGYFRYYYVFATGTKAGQLNTFQYKGILFKTYEGNIIQSGFRANIQSNEFDFSVTNQHVADILLRSSGRDVELHYKRYFGSLPWRGMQTYIVDSVYEVRGVTGETIIKPK